MYNEKYILRLELWLPECDSRKAELKTHVQSIHEGKKTSECDICDYKCSRKSDLKTHIKANHEVKEPQKCTFYWMIHFSTEVFQKVRIDE